MVSTQDEIAAASDEQSQRSFAFGPFLLVPARQLLLKDGVAVRIGGRALDLLVALSRDPANW